MRRSITTLTLAGVLTPLLLALPVTAETVHPARPVRTSSHLVAVTPVAAPAAVGAVVATASSRASFQTVGATWDAGSVHPGQQVEVRARVAGHWSAWQALELPDAGPDTGSRDARAVGSRPTASAPLYVGDADAAEARVRTVRAAGVGAAAPTHLELVLVDPGSSAADADPTGAPTTGSSAHAGEGSPAVLTRAQWGADESLRGFNGSDCTTPDYSATIKVGFVHHTDGANGYSAAAVPGIIRGIYDYHVKTQGWCDVGYNFLVDRFGRTWEGRYGGTARPVLGAHTGGFNKDSFAASMIGDFTATAPTSSMINAVQHLFAWKLGLYYRDPFGTAQLVSAGGGTDKFPKGQTVTFNTISGHRDAGSTTCPGQKVYDQLGTIRTGVRAYLGAALVSPSTSATSASYASAGPTVRAGVLQQQDWVLQLVRACDRRPVRTWTGSTRTSLSQQVDLRDTSGVPLRPGAYSLVLSSSAGSDRALPWTTPLTISVTTPALPAQSGAGAPAVPADFVPVTPSRLLDTRTSPQPVGPGARVDVAVTGVGGVPPTGVAAVALNVTGVCASLPTYLTVYPADAARAGTSTVNLLAGQNRASLVLPRVGPDGRVSVYNASGSTDVLVDVVGWYPSVTAASRYHAVTPQRLVDTRRTGQRVARDGTLSVPVVGQAGVPATATAVILDVTSVGSTAPGFLTVSPSAASRPSTSTLNFGAGQIVPNRAVTGLSEGAVSVYAGAAASDVLVDVVGWYGPATEVGGTQYTAQSPVRVLDTRSGLGAPVGAVGPAGTLRLPLAGRAGVPADARSVVLTLTATGATAEGYVTAWPGGTRYGTSDLNLVPGATVANLVVVPLASDGSLSLYNAAGSTHLVADVLGWYR